MRYIVFYNEDNELESRLELNEADGISEADASMFLLMAVEELGGGQEIDLTQPIDEELFIAMLEAEASTKH